VLLVNTTLGLYKPRGLTSYGRRKQEERRIATMKNTAEPSRNAPNNAETAKAISLRLKIAIAVISVIVVVLLILHLSNAGLVSHGR
jgi:uncharacterized membrane protein YvbJ